MSHSVPMTDMKGISCQVIYVPGHRWNMYMTDYQCDARIAEIWRISAGNVVGDFQAILAGVLIGIMDECGRMKDLADYYSVICVLLYNDLHSVI